MSLVQKIKGDEKTFGPIANTILTFALKEATNSSRVAIVFDVYKEQSIKNAE